MTESSPPNLGRRNPGRRTWQPEPPALDDRRRSRRTAPRSRTRPGFVGPYQFPDNSRRRWPGVIYLVIAALCVGVYVAFPDSPIVNVGWLRRGRRCSPSAAVISITSGWRMHVDETEALVAAQRAVGFAVGHASAQQVWRGLRSRPTWRVLCYSAEDPPVQRGLVLVDADRRRGGAALRRSEPGHRRPALTPIPAGRASVRCVT